MSEEIRLDWPEPPARLLGALARTPSVAVIPHVLPDVDALASAEALCRVLRAAGHEAWAHVPELPEIYAWALDASLRREGAPEPGTLRLAVDTARPDRLQIPGPVHLNVDHHEDNPGFGEVAWIITTPSCSCLSAPLAQALEVPVRGPLATAIFRGLLADTEGFRIEEGAQAFAWGAWLAARGADLVGSAEAFARRSPSFWSYLAEVQSAATHMVGVVPLLLVPVPKDLAARHALLPYEHALLPSHLSPPPGGVLAILQEGPRGVRFRLRSRGVDLLPLAHALGGGGHPQAAGVQLAGADLATARQQLLEAWQRCQGALS